MFEHTRFFFFKFQPKIKSCQVDLIITVILLGVLGVKKYIL